MTPTSQTFKETLDVAGSANATLAILSFLPEGQMNMGTPRAGKIRSTLFFENYGSGTVSIVMVPRNSVSGLVSESDKQTVAVVPGGSKMVKIDMTLEDQLLFRNPTSAPSQGRMVIRGHADRAMTVSHITSIRTTTGTSVYDQYQVPGADPMNWGKESSTITLTTTNLSNEFTLEPGTEYDFSISGTFGGGTVAFYYWNGSEWVQFEKADSTAYNITETENFIYSVAFSRCKVVISGATNPTVVIGIAS